MHGAKWRQWEEGGGGGGVAAADEEGGKGSGGVAALRRDGWSGGGREELVAGRRGRGRCVGIEGVRRGHGGQISAAFNWEPI